MHRTAPFLIAAAVAAGFCAPVPAQATEPDRTPALAARVQSSLADYQKAVTKALNAHDKASALFYKGVEKATTTPGTDLNAAISGLVPVYEVYRSATDELVDALLDVVAPKDLKKVHRALIVAKLRLSDGLGDQIAAFKSNDPAKMEEAEKRLNIQSASAVSELRKQIELAGYDFDKFAKENVWIKKS